MLGGMIMKKEFLSRQQLDLLSNRILNVENSDTTRKLYNYLWYLYKDNGYTPMNIMIVGSGGSYPVALLAKHVLQDKLNTPNVIAETPQNAIRIIKQFDHVINCNYYPKYDLVIGISYSGTTPDIKAVYDICLKRKFPFLLLTYAKESDLDKLYTECSFLKIISYYNFEDDSGKEKSFISMASTLAPAIIFSIDNASKFTFDAQEYLQRGKKIVEDLDISKIANLLNKKPVIHVFYEWDSLPTAADIESKFTESGIAHVILHEKKNFSHGRCILLYKQDFGLVINLNRLGAAINLETGLEEEYYKYKYDKYLSDYLKTLCKEKDAYYLNIGTSDKDVATWNIKAFCILPYLITSIGECLDIDISRPVILFPNDVKALYKYQGDF